MIHISITRYPENALRWSPRRLRAWRKTLRPGDPVRFASMGENLTGDVASVDSVVKITYTHPRYGEVKTARLLGEVYPINEISRAPQGCDPGLTRSTAKRQVDHSGRRVRGWFTMYLPGIRRLFSSTRPESQRPTIEPGGSPE